MGAPFFSFFADKVQQNQANEVSPNRPGSMANLVSNA